MGGSVWCFVTSRENLLYRFRVPLARAGEEPFRFEAFPDFAERQPLGAVEGCCADDGLLSLAWFEGVIRAHSPAVGSTTTNEPALGRLESSPALRHLPLVRGNVVDVPVALSAKRNGFCPATGAGDHVMIVFRWFSALETRRHGCGPPLDSLRLASSMLRARMIRIASDRVGSAPGISDATKGIRT